MEFFLKPIGIIHTPVSKRFEAPIRFSRFVACGAIEIFPEFESGLDGIEEMSHLMLFYVFHDALNCRKLLVKPFLDDKPRGASAARRGRVAARHENWQSEAAIHAVSRPGAGEVAGQQLWNR